MLFRSILERARFKLDMDGKVIQAGRFDNKSSETDRDAMLRTLLETADMAESGEQDEMEDDELNMMLARSDEELVTFQRLDEERARDSVYGSGPKSRPRLMGEEELPDIYLHEGNPIALELPARVTLEITDTEPVTKGQTASGSFKPAVLSNGVRTAVPQYITVGTKVVVMTEDGSYVERAKD